MADRKTVSIVPLASQALVLRSTRRHKLLVAMQRASDNAYPGHSSANIRTGCMSCLNARVKCTGENPKCKYYAISEDWRCNSDLAWQWHGTWRERRGLHVFVEFATSPERAGLFESNFWHRTVMLGCYNIPAIYHIAAAIGALYDPVSRQRQRRGTLDESSRTFALRQCNKSISLLTAEMNTSNGLDPNIALVTCILFACFEALQGDPGQAMLHSGQGRKLLRDCENLVAQSNGSQIFDMMDVRPIVGGLEIQTKSVQGRAMETSDTTEDPLFPDVSHLHGLEHANWTLHFVYIHLMVFCQGVTLEMTPSELARLQDKKFATFVPWLKQWEASFTDLLFRDNSQMSEFDLQRAKVLKANHIAAQLLATVHQGKTRDVWNEYEPDFRAIIDLAASVLNSPMNSIPTKMSGSTFQFGALSFGMWVTEPLFITIARCTNPELRRQAAGLLAGQREIARSDSSSSFGMSPAWSATSESYSSEIIAQSPDELQLDDTSLWTIDQWIEWAGDVRLDTGMATYFGHLPENYIEKPIYDHAMA